MKSNFAKVLIGFLAVSVVSITADAQRTSRKNQKAGVTQPVPGNQTQVNNNTVVPPYNPLANIPIKYDTTASESNIIKKSLRPDNAFDKSSITARTPLPYEHIRWDDALYAEKVWRELDIREKMNLPFRYEAEDDNGSQMFINMLLKAVNSGEVTAFADDRFTTPLKLDEINSQMGGTYDTIARRDINDPSIITEYVITKSSFDPKTVVKLRIKEEWVFDREASRLVCRILGIAPLLTRFHESGEERGTTVMFWLYYPDLRPNLSKYEVYNPKNMGQNRMTWEELFESRMFASYIVKSTLDNPTNKNIRQVYKDQILALLEGDNVREKIFNYEQDLWSY